MWFWIVIIAAGSRPIKRYNDKHSLTHSFPHIQPLVTNSVVYIHVFQTKDGSSKQRGQFNQIFDWSICWWSDIRLINMSVRNQTYQYVDGQLSNWSDVSHFPNQYFGQILAWSIFWSDIRQINMLMVRYQTDQMSTIYPINILVRY